VADAAARGVLDGSAEAEAEGEAEAGAPGAEEGPADRSTRLRAMIATRNSDAQTTATEADRPNARCVELPQLRPRMGCSAGSARM
jgi:hypothetical protein